VVGVTMFGGYSTHVLVPRAQLLALPDSIPPQIAAGLPCAVLTAWYALHLLATPGTSPGGTEGSGMRRSCLIHSAAGGVGSMIARLAKASGRWHPIVGVVGSAHKVPVLEGMGCCDVVVCKRPEKKKKKKKKKKEKNVSAISSQRHQTDAWWADIEAACPGGAGLFDAVFDANGAATFQQSYDHLKPEGRLVVYGFHTMLPKQGGRLTPCQWVRMAWSWLRSPTFDPLDMVPSNKSVLAFNLSFLFDRTDIFAEVMGRVLDMAVRGELGELPEPALYPLEEVGRAHADIESGMTTGKLVLDTR
jgi:NADPH:quinone reductase-like Zn-dependent oxidoreductase